MSLICGRKIGGPRVRENSANLRSSVLLDVNITAAAAAAAAHLNDAIADLQKAGLVSGAALRDLANVNRL